MMDAVPMGCLTIPEAVKRLEDAIRGREKFDEKTWETINAAKDAKGGAGRLSFARQEAVMTTLWAGFFGGRLNALVRDPDTRELLRIPKEDWYGGPSWEVWLGSGVVRAAMTQKLASYNGRRIFVDAEEFERFLRDQSFAEKTGTRRGRKPKADWGYYEIMFKNKVASEGLPDRQNVEGWQTQADVARWIEELAQIDGVNVSETTLKDHARKFIANAS